MTVPSFERDIKPLFRSEDRTAMEYYIDLWDYEQVKDDAENVLARVEDLSMPCDDPWDDERIGLLRDWIAEGCDP